MQPNATGTICHVRRRSILRVLAGGLGAAVVVLSAGWSHPAIAGELVRIVAFGDSLTAGYGLPADQSFPAQLEAALRKRGHLVEIANAGVSGDTAEAALQRFDWAFSGTAGGASRAQGAIVVLGGNDALRGLPTRNMSRALDAILRKLKARRTAVLLSGMKAPRNLGKDYVTAFDAVFPALARVHNPVFDAFFLEGVASVRKLNQRDGIHPNARGVAVIVARILPAVERLLERIAKQAGKS